MKKFTTIACLIAVGLGMVAVTGAALAMSAGRPSSDVQLGKDRYACFDPAQVRSFDTVSDNKIIITSDRNEAYELSLTGICFGLQSSFGIGIQSRMGGMSDICGPFDGEIVFRDHGSDRIERCTISQVRHLTGEEAAPYVVKRKSERSK
ncbi:DUF6491 family protein [Asticcacaulis benevestitus]|uniref:Beta/gamma crystallin 'Greek key' domain-containing protein n=1 Tax=Asticcacaulis benevestitus DSM 16100 = ATCC BAA-896 TaxID=1121022 RepID=V4RRW0_9CAUL|nr:DUF6491 family protein [Asticcacaulis benevestitus]ESQ93933.1 hypothetical protein ABENE_04390 [Asticcacaulis benevestitus DSM 16100 = ATCC BAA-896]